MTDTIQRSPVQDEIIELVRKSDEPVQPKEMENQLNRSRNSINSALRKLKDVGDLKQPGYGLYDLPERVEDQDKPKGQQEKSTENGPETLPLLNTEAHASESGGAWEIEVESYMSVDRDILRAQSGGNPDQMAIMTVPGNQMKGTINPGDQIIIIRHQEGDRILQGGVYVWLNEQRGVLIYRAVWQDDGSLTLRPDNDDCPKININEIEAPAWRPIGRVFRVMRAL